MGFVVFGSFLVVLLLVVSGMALEWSESSDYGPWLGAWLLFLGALFLGVLVFVMAPAELPTGLPKTNISSGAYDIAFVYVADKKVSVGLKFKPVNEKNDEVVKFYQFDRDAFEGDEIKSDSKKLTVIESGSFRKLRLE